jgi:hypothetical protein
MTATLIIENSLCFLTIIDPASKVFLSTAAPSRAV